MTDPTPATGPQKKPDRSQRIFAGLFYGVFLTIGFICLASFASALGGTSYRFDLLIHPITLALEFAFFFMFGYSEELDSPSA